MKEINLAKVIIAKRREKGITQDELAEYVGVSKASVSKWETGHSYPDITHLPVLASYFDITIDQLVDYSRQLPKAEIEKTYARLAASFASEPFEDVITECEMLVKKYYSCYPLLLKIALLYINHAPMAADAERRTQILRTVIGLCERTVNDCRETGIVREAMVYQAMCHMSVGEPSMVLELLDNDDLSIALYGTIIAQAHQMMGNVEKAKEIVQLELLQNLMSTFEGLLSHIRLNMDDFETARAAYERAESLSELFNMRRLNPNNSGILYALGAHVYQAAGKSKEAIEILGKYVDVCTNGFFPFAVRGDSFFSMVDNWLQENSGSIPRDEAVVKKGMLNDVLLDPAFNDLRDLPEFIDLTRRLEKLIEGA